MKQLAQWAFVTAATMLIISAAPAIADDNDVYVAPLDDDSSDEELREDSGSGFDVPGPFYIDGDDYDSGDQGDGTWVTDVPDVPPPTIVEEDDGVEEEYENRRR